MVLKCAVLYSISIINTVIVEVQIKSIIIFTLLLSHPDFAFFLVVGELNFNNTFSLGKLNQQSDEISEYSLRKTAGKVSPTLVTLTSRSDSDFERSKDSLKKINLMALIRTLTISTTTFERMKKKFYVFGRVSRNTVQHAVSVTIKSYSSVSENPRFLGCRFCNSI